MAPSQSSEMRLVPAMWLGRNGTGHLLLKPSAAVDLVKTKWGAEDQNHCEEFYETTQVHPYYDKDRHFDWPTLMEKEPSEEDKARAMEVFKGQVRLLHHGSFIVYATRHGWKPDRIVKDKLKKGGYKVSLRAYVLGLVTTPADIRRFLETHAGSPMVENLDTGVYGSTQLLACIGCCKGDHGDVRTLVPELEETDLVAFFVQALTGDEVPFSHASKAPEANSRAPKRQRLQAPEATEAARGMADAELAERLLATAGHAEGCKLDRVVGNSVYFRTEGTRDCPYGVSHVNNNFYVQFRANGNVVYHCRGQHCREAGAAQPCVLGQWKGVSYAELRTEFERTHFKVMNPLAYCSETEAAVIFDIRRGFRDKHENLYCTVPGNRKEPESKAFVPLWMRDSKLRTYHKVDFLPPPAIASVPDVYNTWKGLRAERLVFTAEELAAVDLTLPLEHVRLLGGGEPGHADYLLKWHAQIVQAPGEMSGIAVVFRSEQEGVGKNVWLDWFGNKVLGGDLYTSTADIDQLLGRFANGRHQKLLVNLDETKGRDTFAHGERIKNAITATHTHYEAKGLDPVQTANYARWVFTTNNTTPVAVGPNDRRFVCFDCCADHANDAGYFDPLRAWMREDLHAAAFLAHLKSLDLSAVDWVNDRPRTQLWEDLRIVNIPVIARFAQHAVTEALFQEWVPAREVYAAYKAWAEEAGVRGHMSETKFGRELKAIEGIEFSHGRGGSRYSFQGKGVEEALVAKHFWVGDRLEGV